ncbi:Leiomodin-2 [Chytriomyces hyalinus]|nr:Leiomodin-2 [Chytriomyces hyalinus]
MTETNNRRSKFFGNVLGKIKLSRSKSSAANIKLASTLTATATAPAPDTPDTIPTDVIAESIAEPAETIEEPQERDSGLIEELAPLSTRSQTLPSPAAVETTPALDPIVETTEDPEVVSDQPPKAAPEPPHDATAATAVSPEPQHEFDDNESFIGTTLARAPSVATTIRSRDSRAVSQALENLLADIERVKNNDPEMSSLTLGSSHAFTTANASAIITCLADNTTLKQLNLSNCRIQNRFAIELAGVLKVNRGLEVINLDGNMIGPAGIKAFADALKVNTTLRELRLSNQLSLAGNEAEAALASSIQKNTTLIKLSFVFKDVAARNNVANALTRNNNAYRGRS